jgi:3-oxoacyl-[acyl-carrier-protein] synthase-3
MGLRIIGTGSYVPDSVVTNEHLKARLGFEPEWIVKRTGIHERRHALPDQATSDLCYEAGKRCIESIGFDRKKIDLLVLGTFTADMTFPATSCLVQDRLGLNCPAIEIQAACAGFVYSLVTAATYILAGAAESALVIGGDCNSRILNPADIKTYPLFGDGAGAVLLTRGRPNQGIVAYSMGADGSGGMLIHRAACGSRIVPTIEAIKEEKHLLFMDGRAVFRWATNILTDTIKDVLAFANMEPNAVDLYIPHQANIRIINAAIDVLHIDRGRVFNNLEKYGNTSGGSIPLALDEAIAEGRIKDGQTLLMSGFGAGLAWGTALFRW